MFRTLPKQSHKASSQYLQALYLKSKKAQTPFFSINSSSIKIIEDPLDFYLLLKKSICSSNQRIGLSCLYLSNDSLENYLLDKISERHKSCPSLQSVMVFDSNRSSRKQNGQALSETLSKWSAKIGTNSKVSFFKVGFGNGVIGEVLGVHHQKIYIFDDKVVLTGANLSKNYFLNRRDRCILVESPEFSDYLYKYLQLVADNPTVQKFAAQYKLWKKTYMPRYYCKTFNQQIKELSQMKFNIYSQKNDSQGQKNQQKSNTTELNQSIMVQQFKKQKQLVRKKLLTVKYKDQIENCFQNLCQIPQSPIINGKDVYLFPFIQWSSINQTVQYEVFSEIVNLAAQNNHTIRLTSGYPNLGTNLIQNISKKCKLDSSLELLCSAPEANSFFKAGGFKSYVPVMYRCYEWHLLQKLQNKVNVKQFSNGQWSYHAKGIWVQQAQDSYLSIIGSSNFNERSKSRDSQVQFYIYSSSQQLNVRFNNQWKTLQKDCRHVDLKQIQEDSQTKINWLYCWLSKLASSIL